MSTAAISMCKDESDIAEAFVRHMAWHVDELIVADNQSSDGTREMLDELAKDLPLIVLDDPELAYRQSEKMTGLAQKALERGFSWVVCADFDELWYVAADPQRRIADYLAGLGPDAHIVQAQLFNHLPTAADPRNQNPFERIAWRKRERAPLPKVACRLHPSLVVHQGNHSAYLPGAALSVGGLCVRHFSWRSPEQFVRKIRNGESAYRATNLPPEIGAHWRAFEGKTDEAIVDHFKTWFWVAAPKRDDSLIYDPAPMQRATQLQIAAVR